jgi:hypothetical protein
LRTLGHPIGAHDLRSYLVYLADRKLVRLMRREDMPGFRLTKLPDGDMHPDDIMHVWLTADGVDQG